MTLPLGPSLISDPKLMAGLTGAQLKFFTGVWGISSLQSLNTTTPLPGGVGSTQNEGGREPVVLLVRYCSMSLESNSLG